MKLNVKAANFKAELFALLYEIKNMKMAAWNANQLEAFGQIGSVALELESVYANLPDLFIDACRDTQDQSYNVEV